MIEPGGDESEVADEWSQPEWWGPPIGWVGGVVPAELVLGKSDSAAVVVTYLSAYPTGVAFQLRALRRPSEAFDSSEKEWSAQSGEAGISLVGNQLHFGVEFEDGRRAERSSPVGGPGDFTIMAFQEGKPVTPSSTANIVLNGRGGGSGPDGLVEDRFVWPLPPGGPLAFFCEWSAVGIPECRVELEEGVWREAVARAHPLHLTP
jgi:hypothetical protein